MGCSEIDVVIVYRCSASSDCDSNLGVISSVYIVHHRATCIVDVCAVDNIPEVLFIDTSDDAGLQ